MVDSGFLQLGIHVTTFDLNDGPVPKREPNPPPTGTKVSKIDRSKIAKQPINSVEDGFSGAFEATEYAKNRPRRQLASAHVGATTESLDLTHPQEFVGPQGTGAPLAQPFAVSISSEALLVMEFYAHLSKCEVIGLMGGTFESATKVMRIIAAYPCRRAAGSDSSTSVELDAASQVEVTCAMEEAGLIPVGWFHSHPVFEPRPSAKDNENQRNYQALCRDGDTGMEPWVGAIVSPYDKQLPTAVCSTRLWVVRQQGRQLIPYNIRHSRAPPDGIPGPEVERQLVMCVLFF